VRRQSDGVQAARVRCSFLFVSGFFEEVPLPMGAAGRYLHAGVQQMEKIQKNFRRGKQIPAAEAIPFTRFVVLGSKSNPIAILTEKGAGKGSILSGGAFYQRYLLE